MEKEIKDKWLTALRSGEYQQTQGQLKKGDAYCCLGVLCEVAGFTIDDSGNGVYRDEQYLGYTPLNELMKNEIVIERLWRLNDREGLSFPEIADYIEKSTDI